MRQFRARHLTTLERAFAVAFLSVCHTRDPRLNGSTYRMLFAAYNRAMLDASLSFLFVNSVAKHYAISANFLYGLTAIRQVFFYGAALSCPGLPWI